MLLLFLVVLGQRFRPSTAMALRVLQATSFIWAGGLLAIALEAWVKFSAPSVTREIGLDVGRHVFGAVNKPEIGLAAALLGALHAGWPGR